MPCGMEIVEEEELKKKEMGPEIGKFSIYVVLSNAAIEKIKELTGGKITFDETERKLVSSTDDPIYNSIAEEINIAIEKRGIELGAQRIINEPKGLLLDFAIYAVVEFDEKIEQAVKNAMKLLDAWNAFTADILPRLQKSGDDRVIEDAGALFVSLLRPDPEKLADPIALRNYIIDILVDRIASLRYRVSELEEIICRDDSNSSYCDP